MSKASRRQVLKYAVGCVGFLLEGRGGPALSFTGEPATDRGFEVRLSTVSAHTCRLSILPIEEGRATGIPWNGVLLQKSWGAPVAKLAMNFKAQTIRCGSLSIAASSGPLLFAFRKADGRRIQELTIDNTAGTFSFDSGDSPLLGLGEGGPQFDRRGSTDGMLSGQRGYELATHGARVPIPWIISTDGWALFVNQPSGTFDFTGPYSRFRAIDGKLFPLDLFIVAAESPAGFLSEYARLTGLPEMLPRWALGYQQSHRTLASREEILEIAKTFREKKLPCDALIYLGTGFCPSGWNTANGSFAWNDHVFPDPQEILDRFHSEHFHVVLHSVILTDKLHGTVKDACQLARFDEQEVACYWDAHRKDFSLGVDGWWPDEGDSLDVASTVARHRMYWEGPQMDRPNLRPYALHRNGFAGMQRYASILWSGDVDSRWETLKTHVPIAINTALTGIPYWGTDIGGFVPTSELTAELYLRWFQFGAFNPLFRSHGRTWKLRLPWGWNTGDPGPVEIRGYADGGTPDASQLHNPQVEIICKKYLELRYRLLPYLYSLVHESTKTGMPPLRSLWLHYPEDPKAAARGDEFLWGPSLLVAPVVEKGATSRNVYLPHGTWFDFWTGEAVEGGGEVTRKVDLETTPLYVRAGSILPLGPVKQYAEEKVDEPLFLSIYPGADASFLLYDDDGVSFNFRQGEWMGLQINWEDARRALRLQLARGSRMVGAGKLRIMATLHNTLRPITFDGSPVELKL